MPPDDGCRSLSKVNPINSMKRFSLICLTVLATLLGSSCVETYPSRSYAYRDYDYGRYHRSDWDRYHGSHIYGRRYNDRDNDRRYSSTRFGDSRYIRTSSHYRHY